MSLMREYRSSQDRPAVGYHSAVESAGPASKLRGRVSQEIDNAVSSASKVLTGVGGMLDAIGGVISRRPPKGLDEGKPSSLTADANGGASNRESPVRRSTTPGPSAAASNDANRRRARSDVLGGAGKPSTEVEGQGGEANAGGREKDVDTRSIRSISSLLSRESFGVGSSSSPPDKLSIGDRLASIPGLSRFGSDRSVPTTSGSPHKVSCRPSPRVFVYFFFSLQS
jgi:hypothetical protein